MTTGRVEVGSTNGTPFYYLKQWDGTNGKTIRVPAEPSYYYKRVRIRKGTRQRTLIGVTKSGHKRYSYRYIPPLYADKVMTIKRYRRERDVQTWNSYNRSALIYAQCQKGTDPTYGAWMPITYIRDAIIVTWTSNDDLELYAKLASEVKGHSFNLGVALGEGRETTRMVLGTLHRVANSVVALRRGRIDIALRQLGAVPKPEHRRRYRDSARPLTSKDVSGMWLEIQYGWKPLLRDVHESMKAYSALTDKARSQRFIAKKTITGEKYWYPVSTCKAYARHRISKRIIYEASELLSTPRSLGLLDPASVAWELVPFSFVADWFVPIGTYLEALSTIPNLQGRFLVQTRTYKEGQERGLKVGLTINWVGAAVDYRGCQLTRTPTTSISVPRPRFNSISESLSVGRIKNAIALLHQTLF